MGVQAAQGKHGGSEQADRYLEGDRDKDIALPTNVHLMHTDACTHMKETDRQTDYPRSSAL